VGGIVHSKHRKLLALKWRKRMGKGGMKSAKRHGRECGRVGKKLMVPEWAGGDETSQRGSIRKTGSC